MLRTERILVMPSDPIFRAIAHVCREAKTIYNCASYLMRQSFFDGQLIPWATADKLLKSEVTGHPSYSAIPTAMSQAIINMDVTYKLSLLPSACAIAVRS